MAGLNPVNGCLNPQQGLQCCITSCAWSFCKDHLDKRTMQRRGSEVQEVSPDSWPPATWR